MGLIGDIIGNKIRKASTQAYNYGVRKRNEYVADRNRRKTLDQEIKVQERDAFNREYRRQRIANAAIEGQRAAKKGGGNLTSQLANYGASFSKAGEDMFGLDTFKNAGGPSNDFYYDMLGTAPTKRTHHRKRRH